MRNSKYMSKKILVPVAISAVAIGLMVWGLSPAIAVVNQTINSGAPAYTTLPTIVGSVNVGQSAINFLKDNLKVSFLQASEIAGKQVPNGMIVAGHLGVVRGYLIYTFFIVNTQDQTRHLIMVDAGNAKVLYTSQA
ncbi:MAG: hypothetical protein WBZ36_30875 [Candidatus Nitrosopolaris sp.]